MSKSVKLLELFEKNGIKLKGSNEDLRQGMKQVVAENEIKGLETNANEVMHTGNTGYGAELIPTNVLSDTIIDMIPTYSRLLPMLPSNHGNDMAISEKVPVKGQTGLYSANSEWTTGAPTAAQAIKKLPTAQVTITQGQFIDSVALSKRELNYSVGQLESMITAELARGAARTVDALILNADAETGATGNVNLDDAAPTAGTYFLEQDHGIRELAINGSLTHNAGTLAFQDFIDTMKKIGQYSARPSDCLWIFNNKTLQTALGLSEFLEAYKNGQSSTIFSGALSNILGSDIVVLEDFLLTEADGKISTTAGNNTLGGFAYIYKPAIQYGFGQAIEIEAARVAGKGVQLTGTFEFGFAIAQKLAGVTDSSVALGINVTV